MKSISTALLAVLLLPIFCIGQVFKAPEFSRASDAALLAQEIQRHSPYLQQMYAAVNVPTDMKPEEARALVNEKLNELNHDGLRKLYAKLDNDQAARIGIALYLLMNGLSNTDDVPGLDYKSALGGGIGIYLMWTLANFILMPELAYMLRPLKATYDDDEFKERYSYLTLAFTAMYVVRLTAINLLFGLSPNIGYALSGKYKDGNDDWGDIDFDDDGVKRSNFGLAIVAGIMLQNYMMIRLMYNIGLSKLYEDVDYKMYAIMLSVSIPLWKM